MGLPSEHTKGVSNGFVVVADPGEIPFAKPACFFSAWEVKEARS